MKKRSSIIAILLCAAMLTCACAARSDDKIEEPVQAEKQKVKVKEYQGKLDIIEPGAYNNVNGLNLEPGSYISVIGKADGGQFWDEVKKGVDQAAKDINEYLGYEGKDKVKVTYSGPAAADNVDEQVNIHMAVRSLGNAYAWQMPRRARYSLTLRRRAISRSWLLIPGATTRDLWPQSPPTIRRHPRKRHPGLRRL